MKVFLRWNTGRRTCRQDGSPYKLSPENYGDLRKDLERWRGKPFSAKTLQEGFNLESVIGVPAMLYIDHRETEKGTWADVDSILPAPELYLQPSGNYQRAAINGEGS